MKFYDGQLVVIKADYLYEGQEPTIVTVRGIAVTEQPVIGCTWIVTSDALHTDTYPFTAIAVPEIALRPIGDWNAHSANGRY